MASLLDDLPAMRPLSLAANGSPWRRRTIAAIGQAWVVGLCWLIHRAQYGCAAWCAAGLYAFGQLARGSQHGLLSTILGVRRPKVTIQQRLDITPHACGVCGLRCARLVDPGVAAARRPVATRAAVIDQEHAILGRGQSTHGQWAYAR